MGRGDQETPKPVFFLLVGLPASGKTTEAKRLEASSKALRLSSDEWMLSLFGRDDADQKRDVIEAQLIRTALRALKCGLDVVLDFGLWARDERSALVWLAERAGVEARIVYLPVDPATQLERAQQRLLDSPQSHYPVSAERFAGFLKWFQAPVPAEVAGTQRFDAPPGWAGWGEWAVGRWPALQGLEELDLPSN